MEDIDDIFEEFALTFVGRVRGKGSIAFPSKLERGALDFSVGSLDSLDRYLAHLHTHRRRISGDEWHVTVLWGGAYLGEVIRRAAPGAYRWVDYADFVAMTPDLKRLIPERNAATTAGLLGPGNYLSLPLNKVARFISEGPEHNTRFYAEADIQRALARE